MTIWGYGSRLLFTPNREQIQIATWVAERRDSDRKNAGARWRGPGQSDSRAYNQLGVIGEMGAAEYLRQIFVARSYQTERARHFDLAGIQVKTSSRSDGDLGLRMQYCRDCTYLLLTPAKIALESRALLFAGYATGDEVFSQTAADPGGVWWLPQSSLHPVPEIPLAAFYDGHSLAALADETV